MARKTALEAAGFAVQAVLVAAIGLTAFVAYGLINNAWYHVLAVRGGSMEPAIGAGDLIVITRPPERIEVGQVLTLQVDGAVVTHRVVEVRPDGSFVTKGDANETRDDFSANDVRVAGEYRFSIPFVGTIVDRIVSGAWFNDDASSSATASSGTWESIEDSLAPDERSRRAPGARDGQEPSTEPTDPRRDPEETPTPSPALTPEPTPSPEPTVEPTPTEAPGPTSEPAPSEATEPTPTPEPTAEPEPTEAPEPTAEPEPTSAPEPTAEPEPTMEPESTETPDPTTEPESTEASSP